jgi:hypothetical protein
LTCYLQSRKSHHAGEREAADRTHGEGARRCAGSDCGACRSTQTSFSPGIFGEPRANVLELNLELAKTFPAREPKVNTPTAEATPTPAVTPAVATAPEALAPVPAPERPAAPPVPEEAAPPVAEVPATKPSPVKSSEKPASKPVAHAGGMASAVFPSEISAAHAGEKPSVALLKTCSDQYHANAKTYSNGGLNWNTYWKECKKRLKG